MTKKRVSDYLWREFWYEAQHSRVMSLACSRYCTIRRRNNNIRDYLLIGIPAVGSALFEISPFVTLGSAIFTAVGNFLEKFFNIFTQSEVELNEIYDLGQKYDVILINLEEEMAKFINDKSIPDDAMISIFKTIKENRVPLDNRLDKLMKIAPNSKRLNKAADDYLRFKYEIENNVTK